MVPVLVHLNLSNGSVIIFAFEDGESCELQLQWRGNENNCEGFYVVENTFNSLMFAKGMFIKISELASEILIRECVRGVASALDSTDIQYITDNGIRLSGVVFMPPSIVDNDSIEEFVSAQADLSAIWGDYHHTGELAVQHFDTARKDEVLYDLISLLNFERFILFTQLEKSS